VDPAEVEVSAVRAQGAGGQNVNKVASAIHLRYDIGASSLPEPVRERLLALRDTRIGADGVVVIKAQRFRTRERNLVDALERLQALVDKAAVPPRPRVPTRPSLAAKRRRLEDKRRRGEVKARRGSVAE
ncbi:MAG: alternative ribosome rescue aminoacyl-tRNA hydrolase ArfB, partial [Burkholderiaceae bacterium]